MLSAKGETPAYSRKEPELRRTTGPNPNPPGLGERLVHAAEDDVELLQLGGGEERRGLLVERVSAVQQGDGGEVHRAQFPQAAAHRLCSKGSALARSSGLLGGVFSARTQDAGSSGVADGQLAQLQQVEHQLHQHAVSMLICRDRRTRPEAGFTDMSGGVEPHQDRYPTVAFSEKLSHLPLVAPELPAQLLQALQSGQE